MKRPFVWIILGVIALGALVALPGLFMSGAWGAAYGGRMMGGYGGGMMPGGMMGGMMSGGMMANGFGPWGWIGMILGWATSLAVLAFLVTATVWLVRSLASPRGSSPAGSTPASGISAPSTASQE